MSYLSKVEVNIHLKTIHKTYHFKVSFETVRNRRIQLYDDCDEFKNHEC